ncbi:MAG: hypothetical protein EXR75_03965 [Myxococcales bacterium]|nr:hypothetical protein [Myxococcales bacterium]
MPTEPLRWKTRCDEPYELVAVTPLGSDLLPEPLRPRVLIHTVHDGDALPVEFLTRRDGSPISDPVELERRYIRERDWGANLVASKIASALGLGGYVRCNIARVLLDFNRFPGSTPPLNHDPLERLAINEPFASGLDHAQKLTLLERYYDQSSELIESSWLDGNLIMLGVHTYDERNQSQTIRPDISLVTCSHSYLRESRMPFGVFDPLYPDVLGESTCSRILRDRISLNCERTGFRVLHNHPYALPEGSIEVRAQVWYFFDYLRRRYIESHPETRHCPAHALVWLMLLNTNLRVHDAETLHGYLHRFRKLPEDEITRFQDAQAAYDRVVAFLDGEVLRDYRRSTERPSAIAMEVRKDLLCDFDSKTGRPLPLTEEQANRATVIGHTIASAIRIYFETDRSFG